MISLNIHDLIYIHLFLEKAKAIAVKELYGHCVDDNLAQSPHVSITEVKHIHCDHGYQRIYHNTLIDPTDRVAYLLDRRENKLALHFTEHSTIKSVEVESDFDNRYFVNIVDFIISACLAQYDSALFHCSGVSYRNRNILIPAWAGTGKTEVLIEFINKGAEFIADDWTIVNSRGDFLSLWRSPVLYKNELATYRQYLGTVGLRDRMLMQIYVSYPVRELTKRNYYLRNMIAGFLKIFKVNPYIVCPVDKFAVHGVRQSGKIDIVYLLIKGHFDKTSITPMSYEQFTRRMDACHRYELFFKLNYHMLDFGLPDVSIGEHILQNNAKVLRDCFQKTSIRLVQWPESVEAGVLTERLIEDVQSADD